MSVERGLGAAERAFASSATRVRVWRKAKSPLLGTAEERIAARIDAGESPMSADDLKAMLRR